LGYDLTEAQFVDDEAEDMRSRGKLPNVIVVRKLYGGVATCDINASKSRIWKLQRLDVDVAESMKARSAKKDAEMDDVDEEDFMQEVEADAEMRRNMNLFKSKALKKKADTNDDDKPMEEEEDDDQKVKLDELLDGLVLEDGPDPEDMAKLDKGVLEEEDAWNASVFVTEGEKAAKDGISYIDRTVASRVQDKETAIHVTDNVLGQEYTKDPRYDML